MELKSRHAAISKHKILLEMLTYIKVDQNLIYILTFSADSEVYQDVVVDSVAGAIQFLLILFLF